VYALAQELDIPMVTGGLKIFLMKDMAVVEEAIKMGR
jgi:hypothetical protein